MSVCRTWVTREQGMRVAHVSGSSPTYATHCNTLQHNATHCNTLQHTATPCNTADRACQLVVSHMCNTLQHTASPSRHTFAQMFDPVKDFLGTPEETCFKFWQSYLF